MTKQQRNVLPEGGWKNAAALLQNDHNNISLELEQQPGQSSMGTGVLVVAGAMAAISMASGSKSGTQPSSPHFTAALACRLVANDSDRLRCYDQAFAVLAPAAEKGDLIMVEREEMRRARRSLFGLSVPNLSIFRNDSEEEEPSEIEATVRAARESSHGMWVVELGSGAVWQANETHTRVSTPRPGQKVRIKKTVLGGYMLSVEGQRSIRAIRVR